MFIFFSFLELHWNKFYRAAFCDLGDSIFQGDPFTTDITQSSLILQTECAIFYQSAINMEWYTKFDPSQSISFFKPVINGGFVIGGSEIMLDFLCLFSRLLIPYYTQDYPGIDQVLMNFLAYNQALKQYGIYFTILPDSKTPFKSFTLCHQSTEYSKEKGIFLSKSKRRLSFIHQFDRNCKWLKFISQELCPSLGSWHLHAFGTARYTLDGLSCIF